MFDCRIGWQLLHALPAFPPSLAVTGACQPCRRRDDLRLPASELDCCGGLRPSLRWVRPRSDVERRQKNGPDEPVVRDVAPLRVMHVHGMTSEQGFKQQPLELALA